MSGTGPYRWLADRWAEPFPGASAAAVLLLTPPVFLFFGHFLFKYVFGSVRYELSLPFTVRTIPGREITLVRFADVEVADAEAGKRIVRVPGEGFVSLIGEGNPDSRSWNKVVVDLDKIDFLSARMLGKLIVLQRKLSQRGGRLVLSSLHADVRQAFVITKLDRIFDLCDDQEQALNLLDPAPPTGENQGVHDGHA